MSRATGVLILGCASLLASLGSLDLRAHRDGPIPQRGLSTTTSSPVQPSSGSTRQTSAGHRGLLDTYCVTCHNSRRKVAGLLLDALNLEQVGQQGDVWERVARRLRARTMLPAGMPRPEETTYEGLASWLETSLDRVAEENPNPGRPTIHRLNRTEYQDVGDRIIRFSRDGKFIREYGKTGRRPGEFRGPHQLAYDSQGRLFVADRQNNRLQIFDQNMNFVAEWKQFGRPSGLVILKDDTLMTIDSESGRTMAWADWPGEDPKLPRNPGFTTGVRMGSARTGDVAIHFEVPFSEAGTADSKGNVYIGGDGHKFVRRR